MLKEVANLQQLCASVSPLLLKNLCTMERRASDRESTPVSEQTKEVKVSPENQGLLNLQSLVERVLKSGTKPDVSVPIVLGKSLANSFRIEWYLRTCHLDIAY